MELLILGNLWEHKTSFDSVRIFASRAKRYKLANRNPKKAKPLRATWDLLPFEKFPAEHAATIS